jgi:hypothetical protein
VTLRV